MVSDYSRYVYGDRDEMAKLAQSKYMKKYRKTNEGFEAEKRGKRKYRKTIKGHEALSRSQRKYRRSDKGRIWTEKRLERFESPQIHLNEWEPGTVGHHIDFHYIVYIPESIHQAFMPHSPMKPNKNLNILNSVAYAELYRRRE